MWWRSLLIVLAGLGLACSRPECPMLAAECLVVVDAAYRPGHDYRISIHYESLSRRSSSATGDDTLVETFVDGVCELHASLLAEALEGNESTEIACSVGRITVRKGGTMTWVSPPFFSRRASPSEEFRFAVERDRVPEGMIAVPSYLLNTRGDCSCADTRYTFPDPLPRLVYPPDGFRPGVF